MLIFRLQASKESRPERIHEALRELAGIAAHPHAKQSPLGLAEKEKLKGLWG